ncbi:hypothetical protein HQ520_14885 [bacterium]|nr:hypothetical protein [bacterium]
MSKAESPTISKQKIRWDKGRIEESRNRIRALIQGETVDRVPYPFIPEGATWLDYEVQALDDEKFIEWRVAEMHRVFDLFPEGDYLPSFTNVPCGGQGIVPSLFGAQILVEKKAPPYNTDRIIGDLERDLPKLPEKVDPETAGWGPRLRRRIRACIEATDGQIPIQVADHQSPYGVATKLIGNEPLMMAMFETPELVHELMTRVTDAIAELVHAIIRWAGSRDLVAFCPPLPFPGGGLVLYDDYISVITPDLHSEFCLPYNQRLYDEFGGGHFHTCGPYFPRYLDAALLHKGLQTMDIPTYMKGLSRRREDMLELRRRSREAGIVLNGSLFAQDPIDLVHRENIVQPDLEFLRQMADGGLIWGDGGPVELGKERLKMAKAAVQ